MQSIGKTNFEEEVANSDVPVIIDMWAPWCGPCRSLAPVLEKLASEYEGQVKVVKINIDEEPELAQAFRVQSIPVVIGMVDGEVKDMQVGFRGEAPLRKMFDGLSGKG